MIKELWSQGRIAQEPEFLDHEARRVLVLRALALGDLLVAVPALRGLRAALPGHRVTLAAPAGLAPVAALTAAVDEVVDVRGLDAPLPRAVQRADVAVNLHGSGPQSHRQLLAAAPGRLVAYASAEAGVDGPPWGGPEHEAARWARLVSTTWGVPVDPDDRALLVPDAAPLDTGAAVVHVGAGYGSRRWPVGRWAAVVRGLVADGHRVVLTGNSAERPAALAVAAAGGLDADAVLAGRTSLGDLAALVAAAALVVSVDTGVAHLATAYAVPSVVLFGPAPPARWGPPIRPQHGVLWHGDPADPWREGEVHGQVPDPLLLAVEPAEVLAAATRVVGASPRVILGTRGS